ncbi:MAG: prepilin-type N-terminal cleavage/methylation domain-containing protein [Symploca sp. SIO1B1]|nr:prepilin-type N-terminal cleavage/methylation domain-containing protein [Symploca sp. SIO1B1]
MKTELKAKFLQHLNQSKQDQGFTLIELLVVIIIIGILSAIALPSFLNQANKAKQSEARTYVGSMNRAQQAYYLENNEFADDANFGGLGLGVATQTENYTYEIDGGGSDSVNATNRGKPMPATAPIKAYQGLVALANVQATSEATTLAVLCEANQPIGTGGADGTEAPTFAANARPVCNGDYKDLTGN